ncbi:MAG: hypothetical protein ACRDLB_15310, partial [Actinomycetota bacterium]
MPPPARGGRAVALSILRIIGSFGIPIVAFFLMWLTFDFLRDNDANRFAIVGVALVVGVVGIFVLFWAMN